MEYVAVVSETKDLCWVQGPLMPKKRKVKKMPDPWQHDLDCVAAAKNTQSLGPIKPTFVDGGVDNDTYFVTSNSKVLEETRTRCIHEALAAGRVEYRRCYGRDKIEVKRESDGKTLAFSTLTNLNISERDLY